MYKVVNVHLCSHSPGTRIGRQSRNVLQGANMIVGEVLTMGKERTEANSKGVQRAH